MHLPRIAASVVLGALVAAAMATPTLAHAKLLTAVPAPDAVVDAMPASLVLTFSEPLEAAFSSVQVSGAEQGTIAAATSSIDPANPAGMIVTLPPGLPAGHYTVDWIAVATDGHRLTGSYAFDTTK